MASRSKTKALLLAAAVAVAALLPATASAASYTVGDDYGWSIIPDYKAWARGKDFKVGDILEFVYQPGVHNVVIAGAETYEFCNDPKSGEPTLTSGDDRVRLATPGHFYFMSSVEADCQDGLKLAIVATN